MPPAVPRRGITLVEPHLVVKDPRTYLLLFIDHHTDHLPDLSEGPEKGPQDKDLRYWQKYWMGRRQLAKHTVMPGLCAVRVHTSVDFAMSQGLQCVMFMRGATRMDQTIPFLVAVWCCYLAQMEGRPRPETIAGQNILHYLLNRKSKVARAWRKRQQAYSSA